MSDYLCIVGLGNIGAQYDQTRHNIGFDVLDAFVQYNNFPPFSHNKKFFASISSAVIDGQKIMCIKPSTFMNLSGDSVRAIMKYYNAKPHQFCIIYDDKDMDFGKLRYRLEGSAGGHNGIKSIIPVLTKSFARIKIGVGNEKLQYMDTADFVLSRFSSDEKKQLPQIIEKVIDMIDTWYPQQGSNL